MTSGRWTDVPEGIAFGRKVLVAPPLSDAFIHSGDVGRDGIFETYSWVDAGDPIARYAIAEEVVDLPVLRHVAGERTHTAELRSPASRLALVSGVALSHADPTASPPSALPSAFRCSCRTTNRRPSPRRRSLAT